MGVAEEEGRIASVAALKTRLGGADTILCLGNGPSSEDARLLAYPGACIFRVNWIWLARGFLAAPDVVFTGDADVVALARPPLVIFPTEAIGRPILAGHASAGHAVAGYAFLDRFQPGFADFAAAQYPTNGALMVAVAAALDPRRLVIAGIDLYRHPQGKYAGPADNDAGYTAEHSADIDLAAIKRALDGFAGEVAILSENLARALKR